MMESKLLSRIFDWLNQYFLDQGMNEELSLGLSTLINTIGVVLVVLLLDLLVRKIIVRAFWIFSNRTNINFDDFLVKSKFPNYLAHFVPVIFIKKTEPLLFKGYPFMSDIIQRLTDIYIILLFVLIVRSFLRSLLSYLRTKEQYKDKPLESYLQVLMIFTWGVGLFFSISALTGFAVQSLLTLGAASAAILLIFRDTILGFVASIQVSVNDIVRIGDWISFNKYGADGVVTEINLATVIVQNWDKTFTTIPTYSLTSDSFQNWRGMEESGGRRIKRSISIKQTSVKFLTATDLENFKSIQLVSNYIDHRQQDINKHNERVGANKELLVNGRNQTNLGIFRKYISSYIEGHSAINHDMTLMVRHLQPTDRGIPIEVYCFSADKRWVNYEHVMAEIFDHLLASASYFDLEVFELPSEGPYVPTI